MDGILVMGLVFAVSLAFGYVVISRVPPLLHTPLMSMTNAISAVTLLGAMLVFASPPGGAESTLGAVALLAAAFNVAGGHAITERMLRMFRNRDDK